MGGCVEQNLWAVGVFGQIWAKIFRRPKALCIFVGKKSKWKFEKSQMKIQKVKKYRTPFFK